LRLANNQGIIDAGYRGNLIGMFDLYQVSYFHEANHELGEFELLTSLPLPGPYSRILQICAPGLIPIWVQVVDTVQELGATTSRGDGGFGSTGK
jgi:dUTPase